MCERKTAAARQWLMPCDGPSGLSVRHICTQQCKSRTSCLLLPSRLVSRKRSLHSACTQKKLPSLTLSLAHLVQRLFRTIAAELWCMVYVCVHVARNKLTILAAASTLRRESATACAIIISVGCLSHTRWFVGARLEDEWTNRTERNYHGRTHTRSP